MLGAEVCDATLSIMLVGYGGAAAMETGFYRYRYRIARSRVFCVDVAWTVQMWLRHWRHTAGGRCVSLVGKHI